MHENFYKNKNCKNVLKNKIKFYFFMIKKL